MIDLRMHTVPLLEFLERGLADFRCKHPEVSPSHVALYCCPWSGWVSLYLDREARLEQNCPDFQFVEFALYDAHDWAAQYEEEPRLRIVDADGTEHTIDVEVDGDEAMNRRFHDFLCQILSSDDALAAIRRSGLHPSRLGVQLLDSEYSTSWEPDERRGAAQTQRRPPG